MPEENNPSSSGDARSTTGSPEMGTPASSGATPQPKPASTLEEALARIAELERHASNKAEEAARHGKNLSAAEKELAAYKEKDRLAQEATLTETQRIQKERDELQAKNEDLAAKLKEQNVNQEVARYASKLNFVITSSSLIAQMLTRKEIEWDEESGMPTNIEKLLEKLAKAEPDLVKQQQAPGQPGTPTLPAMNPGRSSITQPGGNVPGKRYTLDDIQWSR